MRYRLTLLRSNDCVSVCVIGVIPLFLGLLALPSVAKSMGFKKWPQVALSPAHSEMITRNPCPSFSMLAS